MEVEHNYEPTGPFGVKSIGAIVINATGVWHWELHITPGKVEIRTGSWTESLRKEIDFVQDSQIVAVWGILYQIGAFLTLQKQIMKSIKWKYEKTTEGKCHCGYTKEKRKELANMAAINMNQEQFQQMMEDGRVVLVDFWAPWCSHCRRINPTYEKIAAQYADNMVVAKVNIDDESQLAEKERIEVIPTLVLYRGGKAIGSIVAPESKAAIDAFIQESLGK